MKVKDAITLLREKVFDELPSDPTDAQLDTAAASCWWVAGMILRANGPKLTFIELAKRDVDPTIAELERDMASPW